MEERPEEKEEQSKGVVSVPAPKPAEKSNTVNESKPAATQHVESQKASEPEPL